MRIISGTLRGRRLKGPEGMELRPTSDRLRQALFNILGADIEGSALLDLFSGTGAIGLEALSRGAREVVYVESSRDSMKILRRNLQECGITEGYRIYHGDVFTMLRALGREKFHADIIFLDPPYAWGPYEDVLETLFRTGIASRNSKVIVEHHRKAVLPESGKSFHRIRLLQQSDKCLSFYQGSETDAS
jgi:16S rRNA (guanine(966)-N(2))-methyltransferase RsmD